MKREVEKMYKKIKELFPDDEVSIELRFLDRGWRFNIWVYTEPCLMGFGKSLNEAFENLKEDINARKTRLGGDIKE